MTPDNGTGWRSTSTRGATTVTGTDETDVVYGDGDSDVSWTTTGYCDKEEEEELPVDEEPYPIPNNDAEILIRDYFNIIREPP